MRTTPPTAPVRRTAAALAIAALLAAGCTDGGAGQDQVIRSPSPTDEPSPTAAPPPSPTATSTSSPTEDAAAAPSPSPSPTPTAAAAAPRASQVLAERDGAVRFTDPWEQAPDPVALAATIERTEAAARDDALSAQERETAGFEAQFAYRQLAATPEWFDQVLEELPEDLRPAARGNVAARDALNRLLGERDEPPTTVPAWRIVPPAPADDLVRFYKEAAEEVGVEWEYLAGINLVETRMGRIRGFSTAGARGPMQFIPESWEIFGEGDIDDERDSIFAAARHLKQRDWDKGPRAALLRYNRSSNYGDAVIAYAEVLQQDPEAYATYHGWQVLYRTPDDLFVFPVGYEEPEPVPLDEYRRRPEVEVSG